MPLNTAMSSIKSKLQLAIFRLNFPEPVHKKFLQCAVLKFSGPSCLLG